MLHFIPILARKSLKRSSIFLSKCTTRLSHSNPLVLALLFVLLTILLLIHHYESKIAQLSAETRNLKILNSVNQINDPHSDTEDKSFQQLPDDLLVLYNRVPKTGSTSFMGISYELCSKNGFNVMHLNTSKNSHVLSLSDQLRFVWNVTRWTRKLPVLIHGHVAFVDFGKFGLINLKPVYINIIRRPLDRLVSYYYFLRNGDNFRPSLIRKKAGDKRTFDSCVDLNEHDCRVENLWLQIPFFCGQHSECWKPGNQWALEQAKRNLLDHYFLVGITERLKEFIQVLEAALPQMFTGATAIYEKGTKAHLRKTNFKTKPSSRVIAKIQQSKIWQMENEFYQFALDNFNFIRDKTLVKVKGQQGNSSPVLYKGKGQQYFFEKIRPK